MIELRHVLNDPTSVFAVPEDVLDAAGYTRKEKIAILRSWAYDARELEVAEEEGMLDNKTGMLDRIVTALAALGARGDGALPSPTKQGGV